MPLWILAVLGKLGKVPKPVWYVIGILVAGFIVYRVGFSAGVKSVEKIDLPAETIHHGVAFTDSGRYIEEIARLQELLNHRFQLPPVPIQDTNCIKYIANLESQFEAYKRQSAAKIRAGRYGAHIPDSLQDSYDEVPGWRIKVTVFPKRGTNRFRYNPVRTETKPEARYEKRVSPWLELSGGLGSKLDGSRLALKLELAIKRLEITATKHGLDNFREEWTGYLSWKFLQFY